MIQTQRMARPCSNGAPLYPSRPARAKPFDARQRRGLVDALRGEGLEVTLRGSNQAFATLAELQRYDSVVLANTPRTSGFGGDDTSAVEGDAISALENWMAAGQSFKHTES
ncbi:MAG: hypothetical protein HC922_02250 [Leptolyngbyaceae cyanobacterium SM2_3_12]|nr:hypothetical protein [Leptolyngbyaceae cyanobacterium SM2_3_12]